MKLSESYANLFYYDSAIEVLGEYLQDIPEDGDLDARYKYAQYSAWNYEWEKAIVQIDKLLLLDPNNLDYQLLNELAINARCPLIELADKFGCSSQSITYRIKNLLKKDIIKAFRVNIDYAKLGLQHHKVDIYLKEHRQRNAIIDFMKRKSYLQCLNVAIGWADIELEFVIRDINEIDNIIDEINSKFPNSIRKHSFWIAEKVHKERWLPELDF